MTMRLTTPSDETQLGSWRPRLFGCGVRLSVSASGTDGDDNRPGLLLRLPTAFGGMTPERVPGCSPHQPAFIRTASWADTRGTPPKDRFTGNLENGLRRAF